MKGVEGDIGVIGAGTRTVECGVGREGLVRTVRRGIGRRVLELRKESEVVGASG